MSFSSNQYKKQDPQWVSKADLPPGHSLMAAMAAPNPTGGAGEGLPMPSRNPLPLSASQEAQIRDIYHKRVRSACAPEIKGKVPPVSSTNPSFPRQPI